MANRGMALETVAYENKSILQNLMELYQYDMSEYEDEFELNDYGLFGYRYIDHYWTEEGRHAYFVKVDGRLAGFVLLRELPQLADGTVCRSIAEFFILRHYRKSSIGRKTAKQVFSQFPGQWSVCYLEKNTIARTFWTRVIQESAIGEVRNTTYLDMKCFEFQT
ncbi:GNAT family N-acetyltransferase [Paenibacillus sp. NPDC056579]|uniref:GNAT family N-acetyltransferase n=1 Tax=Paenibacillus sp. NPDC056579 TaxID=3345871 RepID=UPI00369B4E39